MKNRKGFISIICLIIMSVVMFMILYLEYTTKLEHLILSSTSNNIQSYYLAEGKIQMILHDEKYYSNQLYPILTEYFRALPFSNHPKDIIIDKEDLITGDQMDKIKVNLVDKDDKKQLRLIAKSNYNGLRTTVTSHINIFNELFEIEYPILSADFLNAEYKEDFTELLMNISKDINVNDSNNPQDIYATEFMNFDEIILDKKDDNTFEIAGFRETMIEPYIERFYNNEVFVIARKYGEEPINLFIENSNNPDKIINLSGVIYVEGNITISKQLEFSGIMIVKDGEIKTADNIRPNIEGIMIIDNVVNNDFLDKVDILYSRYYIYKYGTYLPGFIKPSIYLIKSN